MNAFAPVTVVQSHGLVALPQAQKQSTSTTTPAEQQAQTLGWLAVGAQLSKQ